MFLCAHKVSFLVSFLLWGASGFVLNQNSRYHEAMLEAEAFGESQERALSETKAQLYADVHAFTKAVQAVEELTSPFTKAALAVLNSVRRDNQLTAEEKTSPDCDCVGGRKGDDCDCLDSKKPKSVAMQAEKKTSPDCECVGGRKGDDCDCPDNKKPKKVEEKAKDIKAPHVAKKAITKLEAVREREGAKRSMSATEIKDGIESLVPEKAVNMSKAERQMKLGLMVPLLMAMHENFKEDIKRANKEEKENEKRVKAEQAKYADFQKAGKTYLLEGKQRLIDYYKKQAAIGHRHYHAMLKMAHGMMGRVKTVQEMCADAATGKELTRTQQDQLSRMGN